MVFLKDLPSELKAELRPLPFPLWVEPMIATSSKTPPSAGAWFFEPRFEGERCLIFKNRSVISIISHDHRRLDTEAPELVDAVRRQRLRDAVFDGKVVAGANGARMLYLFDLPYFAGHTLVRLPLSARKQILRRALDFKGPLRFTPHRSNPESARRLASVRSSGLGLVARRAESRYDPAPSHDWLFLRD